MSHCFARLTTCSRACALQDVLGTSDPYCTIKLGDQERKTKAIMRTVRCVFSFVSR